MHLVLRYCYNMLDISVPCSNNGLAWLRGCLIGAPVDSALALSGDQDL